MEPVWIRRGAAAVATLIVVSSALVIFGANSTSDSFAVQAGPAAARANDAPGLLAATGTSLPGASIPDPSDQIKFSGQLGEGVSFSAIDPALGSGVSLTNEGDPEAGNGSGNNQSGNNQSGNNQSGSPGGNVIAAADAPGTGPYESMRNRQTKFTRYADRPASQIGLWEPLLEPAPRADNGANTPGNAAFRAACEYSHFGTDDPIIHPGKPGAAHLHMFFGNTELNAFTTEESLINSGGSTCSGFELNRSGYWIPALLDGRGNAVVPDQIILYYKTKDPSRVQPMPQGLQMLAGNTDSETFQTSDTLSWGCGPNGRHYNKTNRIPNCNGDTINASIVFPNCWDGKNKGSSDFKSHLRTVKDNERCPSSHPVRMPKISILVYWPGTNSVAGWHLSSDRTGGFNAPPGGTLHADWWGGWNDDAMNLWINGCMRAQRNCSFGQTGTSRQLAGLNPLERYEGNNFIPLPRS
jgi:hypothetical protein